MKKLLHKNLGDSGQALVTLLVVVIIVMGITTAAIIMLYVSVLGGSKYQQGTIVYTIAESGLENGILQLLRDPSYTGETMLVGSASAVIVVNGSNPWTITSMSDNGSSYRKIEATVEFSNGAYTFTNWRELP